MITVKATASPRRRGWTLWTAAALVLLPALYLLSIGPAFRLLGRGRIPEAAIEQAYYPILWLGQHNDTFSVIMGWYADLWL